MSGHLSDPVDAASLPAVEVDDSGIPKDGVVEHFVRGEEAHGGAENEAGEEEQESVSCMEWKLGDTCRTENSIFWSANGILAVVAGSVVQLIDPAKGRTETVQVERGEPVVLSSVDMSLEDTDRFHVKMLEARGPVQFVAASWSPLGMSGEMGCLLALASSDGAIALHEGKDAGKPVHSLSRSLRLCLTRTDASQLSLSREAPKFSAMSQMDGADGDEEAENGQVGEEEVKARRAKQTSRRSRKTSAENEGQQESSRASEEQDASKENGVERSEGATDGAKGSKTAKKVKASAEEKKEKAEIEKRALESAVLLAVEDFNRRCEEYKTSEELARETSDVDMVVQSLLSWLEEHQRETIAQLNVSAFKKRLATEVKRVIRLKVKELKEQEKKAKKLKEEEETPRGGRKRRQAAKLTGRCHDYLLCRRESRGEGEVEERPQSSQRRSRGRARKREEEEEEEEEGDSVEEDEVEDEFVMDTVKSRRRSGTPKFAGRSGRGGRGGRGGRASVEDACEVLSDKMVTREEAIREREILVSLALAWRCLSIWRLEKEGNELSHKLAASSSSGERSFSAMTWLPSLHPPPAERSFSSLLALGFTDGFVDVLRFHEDREEGVIELLYRVKLSPGGLAVRHLLGVPSDGLKRMVAGTARALYLWREKEATTTSRSVEHESEIAGMAGDGLFSKVFTLSKAGVVRVWLLPEEACAGKWLPLLEFDCRKQQQQESEFGFRALGIAASFHGTHVMFVGRRVTSDKGRQTLTFPSGVESFVRTVRVPGYVETHPQRLELFVQVCRYMHESAAPAARDDLKVTETFKWWWDLEQLARKEVKQEERKLIVEVLEEQRQMLPRTGHVEEQGRTLHPTSSPLHLSCKNGNVWITHLLVLLGSDVNARDKDGCTPLSLASFKGSREIVKCLLDHRAEVGAVDSDKLTALHWSSARGHRDVVKLLLEQHADLAGREGGPSVLEVAHERVKDLILAASSV